VNCAGLLQTSGLGWGGGGVEAVMNCVKCNSWENEQLSAGRTCEDDPPRPVTCRRQTDSTKCMIATDYAADGP